MKSVLCGLAVVLLIGSVQVAAAQVSVIKSASGERTLVSESPHSVGDSMMVRAVSRTSTEGTIRWGLIFYGTGGEGDVEITLDGDPIKPTRVTTNSEAPGGRTRVFLDEKDFYRLGTAGKPRVRVGKATFALPGPVRSDMRAIHRRTL